MNRRLAWTAALVGAFTMTVSYVDRQTLANLAPTVTKALDISDTEYGWLTSAFSIAYLVAVPAAGWWIDRAGARRGLLLSVGVWSIVAALHCFVPGFAVLFALRIALGVAESASFPGAAQTMYRVLPEKDRPRGYGLLFTGSSIGAMVAAPLASALYAIDHSWRIAFLGTAAFGLLWIPLWLFSTRPPEVRAAMDAPAAAASPERKVPFLVAFFDPLVIRTFIGVAAVAPVIGFGMAWASKYLAKDFGVTQEDLGYYLWIPPLGLDLGAIGFGHLAALGRPRKLLFAIAAVLASSLALLPVMPTPVLAAVILGLAAAGGGACNTLLTTDLLARTPAPSVSTTGGIIVGGQSLALIVAGPLIGRSFDDTGSYTTAAIGCAVWLVPGALLWLSWPVTPGARVGQRARG